MEYKLSYLDKGKRKKVVHYFKAKSDRAAIKYAYKFFENIKGYDEPWLGHAEDEQLSILEITI